ncbi:MAG: CPBP family glutamic-type intramembrane protease [bacterium]
MIDHPFFWILFVSLVFWSFFERFDSYKNEYTEHPRFTIMYFLFSSGIIMFIYPPVLEYFYPKPLALLAALASIVSTYWLYKNLPKLFLGPQKHFSEDHHYWKLLDKKYIIPHFTGILFQQTFFGAMVLLIETNYTLSISAFLLGSLMFILAHIPLFILQGKKVGIFYFLWAILGSPLFALVLISTNSLWYSIALHMFFYASLSAAYWLFSPIKYSTSQNN